MTSTPTRWNGSFGLLDSRRGADLDGPSATLAYDPARMSPLLLVAAGILALAVGIAILLTFGSRYRLGRLLAATPKVTVGEALELARSGRPRYVRVDGRIDADEDFPDEHQRPLVYRRQRLQLRRGRDWNTIEDELRQVPFEVREGLDGIGIDGEALDQGLVVLPRESLGTAADVPDRVPSGTPATTPVRMRIDQISAVEHAVILGIPVADGATARLTGGFGRPLVLTTLEVPEAMRVLGEGRRPRSIVAVASLVGGLALLATGIGWALLSAVAG